MNTINHRIMITGAPRSGTTLVQQVLSSHPQIYTVPETHYFEFMLRRDFRKGIDRFRISRDRFLKFRQYAEEHNIIAIPGELKPPDNTRQVVDYFISIMDDNALHKNRRGWVEKTPGHLFYIDQIERYRNDIVFLHILRRPEEVLASLVKVGREHTNKWPGYSSVDKSIDAVDSSYREISGYISKNNHVFVIHEHMLSMPENELTHILEKTGLGFDQELLNKMLSGLSITGLSRDDEAWKTGYGDTIRNDRKSGFDAFFDDNDKPHILTRLGAAKEIYTQVAGTGP